MARPDEKVARSAWLVGLIALAGGLAAPAAMPIAGPLVPAYFVAARQAGVVGELVAASLARPGADPELAAFYAARAERPLWIEHGRVRPEARQLIALLDAPPTIRTYDPLDV